MSLADTALSRSLSFCSEQHASLDATSSPFSNEHRIWCLRCRSAVARGANTVLRMRSSREGAATRAGVLICAERSACTRPNRYESSCKSLQSEHALSRERRCAAADPVAARLLRAACPHSRSRCSVSSWMKHATTCESRASCLRLPLMATYSACCAACAGDLGGDFGPIPSAWST